MGRTVVFIHSAHVRWDLTWSIQMYTAVLEYIQVRCWHGVFGALAGPHKLTLGWQSVSKNSGDALRPEAPAALLRATATAPDSDDEGSPRGAAYRCTHIGRGHNATLNILS